MISDQEKWNLLATVAQLYYNQDMTQNQIAERLYISRSKISRMLKEARRLGIVEIHIHEPWDRNELMEQQLQERLGIQNIRVIGNQGLEGVVEAAAYYLDSLVHPNLIIGISWGNTLYRMIQYIHKKSHKNIPFTVVPIMGASNTDRPELDCMDLAKDLASAYGGRYQYIPAPLIVNNKELRENLLKEQSIQSVLDAVANADVILTSVGSVAAKSWENYISERTLQYLEKQGAVGHIAGHFFDGEGRELAAMEERLIGIRTEQLRSCRNVICIADGEEKAEALVGAIRAGIVKTVIIDDLCARKILSM